VDRECAGGWKHEVRTRRAAYGLVPIQFGWSFLSDREKCRTAGIPKATYTANVQAGKSVIKITISQSAAVTTNAIGNSLVDRSDLFWVMLFPRFVCRRRISAEPHDHHLTHAYPAIWAVRPELSDHPYVPLWAGRSAEKELAIGSSTEANGILRVPNPESRNLRDLTHNYSEGCSTNDVKG